MEADAFVGLDADAQRVAVQLLVGSGGKEDAGRALEDDVDFGERGGEGLAGAEVKGDAVPAPVVDLEAGGDEGFGHGIVRDFFFLAVGGDGLVVDEAAAVLGADGVLLEEIERRGGDRAQDFDLFVADRLGVEGGGRFHRGEGEELEHVVLQHVARGAGVVVVAAAALDADLLGDGDLHMVDIEAVPERLVDGIGEAEVDEVLDGFLAEIMVDAEDVALGEGALEGLVEFLGAVEVHRRRAFRRSGGA